MNFSHILFLYIATLLIVTNSHASRIKKDLLSSKENEILTLVKEKTTILDKLIIEAKIYESEKDPLIEKSFLSTPNLFYTHTKKDAKSVRTGDASSIVYNRRGEIHGIRNGSIREKFQSELRKPRIGEEYYKRNIFNIKIKSKLHSTTTFSNHLNLYSILENDIKNDVLRIRNKSQREEIVHLLDNAYESKLQASNIELMEKYFHFISLISSNDISSSSKTMIALESVNKWYANARMFTFVFDLRRDKFYKKKTYDLSVVLNDTFNTLHEKESITLTQIPEYYDRKISKDFTCIETAQEIKYKGKICINPIDVDKDVYFKYGTFESRENNFIQTNQEYFKSLISLDDKLKKASKEYVEFVILKISSPTQKSEINLEGGL